MQKLFLVTFLSFTVLAYSKSPTIQWKTINNEALSEQTCGSQSILFTNFPLVQSQITFESPTSSISIELTVLVSSHSKANSVQVYLDDALIAEENLSPSEVSCSTQNMNLSSKIKIFNKLTNYITQAILTIRASSSHIESMGISEFKITNLESSFPVHPDVSARISSSSRARGSGSTIESSVVVSIIVGVSVLFFIIVVVIIKRVRQRRRLHAQAALAQNNNSTTVSGVPINDQYNMNIDPNQRPEINTISINAKLGDGYAQSSDQNIFYQQQNYNQGGFLQPYGQGMNGPNGQYNLQFQAPMQGYQQASPQAFQQGFQQNFSQNQFQPQHYQQAPGFVVK